MTSTDPTEALDLDRPCVRSTGGVLCDAHGRKLFPSVAHRCNGWSDAAELALARSGAEGLDVRRVTQAMANIARRHGIIKDPPPDMSLLRIYGYSAATPDMDAEIAAEYARLHPSEPHQDETP